LPPNGTAGSRKNARLEIVDKDFRWNASEECKGSTMTLKPRQQLHIGCEANKQRSRPRQDRNERIELACDAADRDDTHLTPVDLQLLTRLDIKPRFAHGRFARAMLADVLFHDGMTAAITELLQFVEDTLGGPLRRNVVA
jgi:hypothetical protein